MQPQTLRPGATARVVTAAARGDQGAWNQLVDSYSGLLWAIARGYRLSGGEAADVVQTSWLRLIEHLPKIDNPERVGAWLATTARREAVRTLRRTARCQPSDQIEDFLGADTVEVEARLLRDEQAAALWLAFNRLPERDQALLRLLAADPPPSYEEIGAALDMPIGSIGPTRGRALARLRRELQRSGALAAAREAR